MPSDIKVPLEFSTRGRRKSREGGLYYYSRCGEYSLYLSDRLCGMPIEAYGLKQTWKSLYRNQIIGRHTKKSTAARRCAEHMKRLSKTKQSRKKRNAKPDSTA